MDLLLEGEETKRLGFRKLLASDFDAWLPFHQDPRSSQYWKGGPEDPVIACQEQFARVFERYEKGLGGMNALVLRTTGHLRRLPLTKPIKCKFLKWRRWE